VNGVPGALKVQLLPRKSDLDGTIIGYYHPNEARWCAWDNNPARASRDPASHLRWALHQNRDIILDDLCEKYEIAARYQYQHLQEEGLKLFYIHHSVRLVGWGSSVGTLNERPYRIYFEAEAARLNSITANIAAWVDAIMKDLQRRVRRTGYPLIDSG
jgi:hypothetical protein